MRVPESGAERPPGPTRPVRRARSLALPAVAAAATLDVLLDGPLRGFDRWIFQDGLPPRTGAWHLFWRVVVTGGQYGLLAVLLAAAAGYVAWRGRGVAPLVRTAIWLAVTELTIRGAQLLFARTPPRTGSDVLFEPGYLSFPSGHAANAAACLLVLAALLRASRAWTIAAHAVAVAVAFAVVILGYHWPTDALAGWALGTALGHAGRALTGQRSGQAR
ncbi:phosphatase PAP2 family protein [Spirillospora sp. CA-294931]|uniref:phosphatase PAP2 family protein n=1 Tax=Spirillospora sp. CA-294931 TaxID=3240042 RepID=UPI003D8C070D